MPVTMIVALVSDPRTESRREAFDDLHTPYYDRPKVELQARQPHPPGATETPRAPAALDRSGTART
jgi:hypothetical protein